MQYEKLIARTLRAHITNTGGLRKESDIKYIVVHYTANDGDTDEANIKYFSEPNRKASAHFFVDDDSISESVEPRRVAWHCGGNIYSDIRQTGGGKLYGTVNNSNSLGVEMCDTQKDGVHNLSHATRLNAIKLIAALMEDYGIDIDHVVRHFDVTGKHCPVYFMDEVEWNKFKGDIEEYISLSAGTVGHTSPVSPSSSTSSSSSFRVRVKAYSLNIRAGAGVEYKINGVIKDKGLYTIVETQGNWGKLKSGAGWISLNSKYVNRIN